MEWSYTSKPKLIRVANVPGSLNTFCKGLLKKLSYDYEVVALASPGPEMKEIEDREHVRTISLPIERRISVFKDIISLWKMIVVFRKERPTIVHTIGGKCGLLSMIAAWLTRVPIRMYTFTGLDSQVVTKGFLHYVLWFTDKLSCVLATDLLPEGCGVKRDMERSHLTKKTLTVLGHGNIRGIDLDYYCVNENIAERASAVREKWKDDFTFVFVGRVVRDKGINELVSAFKKLYESNSNVRLLIVGPYENDIDPISSESRLYIDRCDHIEAVGSQKDVRPWYAAADCFVLPSYREGFPNSVIEAGAMNLPSIVTDINGANEIIIEGENGIIVPPRNTEALLNAMVFMMTNKDKRDYMRGNARKLVADRYEQKFVHQCLFDYYKQALERL